MVVRAGGQRLRLTGVDEEAAQAFGDIERSGREALTELRRMLKVLRDPAVAGAQQEPVPVAAGILELVEAVRRTGRSVHVDRHEIPPELSPGVALAAHRVVQESLTNALKHAAPGEVRVRLAGPEPLTVAVTSPLGDGRQRDGRPGGEPVPRAPGSGAGLIGMEERVALLGGSFTAGPEAGGDGNGTAGGENGTVGGAAGGGKRWAVRAGLPTGEKTTAPQRRTHG